ncbi:unnamed protein product [Discosporangium mesarthrocarpum]
MRTPVDWMPRMLHTQYERGAIVGSGTFGEVFMATCVTTKEKVALKCIKQDPDGKGFPITAVREMRILRRLEHKNIVNLKEIVVDGQPTEGRLATVALVFEYLEHDLSGLLDTAEAAAQITPELSKCFMKQLLDGVAYMHSQNILHRDLKGANLLISSTG